MFARVFMCVCVCARDETERERQGKKEKGSIEGKFIISEKRIENISFRI